VLGGVEVARDLEVDGADPRALAELRRRPASTAPGVGSAVARGLAGIVGTDLLGGRRRGAARSVVCRRAVIVRGRCLCLERPPVVASAGGTEEAKGEHDDE